MDYIKPSRILRKNDVLPNACFTFFFSASFRFYFSPPAIIYHSNSVLLLHQVMGPWSENSCSTTYYLRETRLPKRNISRRAAAHLTPRYGFTFWNDIFTALSDRLFKARNQSSCTVWMASFNCVSYLGFFYNLDFLFYDSITFCRTMGSAFHLL